MPVPKKIYASFSLPTLGLGLLVFGVPFGKRFLWLFGHIALLIPGVKLVIYNKGYVM